MGFHSFLPTLKARMRHRYSFWLLLGLSLVWIGSSWGHSVSAQAVTQARVTEILDGNQVFIQGRQVSVNSVAQQRQQVRTAAARAELQFNTGAVARLAQNSSLTVGDCAQLRRGTLLVNGALNGCTATTVAGVRGTLYTLEVNEADQTIIRVFEGEVLVSPQPAGVAAEEDALEAVPDEGGGFPAPSSQPEAAPATSPGTDKGGIEPIAPSLGKGAARPLAIRPRPVKQDSSEADLEGADPPAAAPTASAQTVPLTTSEPVAVSEGQQITIAVDEPEALVEPLSVEDFQALLQGPLLSDFSSELPGLSALQGSFERLFPGVPFPLSLPSLPIPSIPFSFPF